MLPFNKIVSSAGKIGAILNKSPKLYLLQEILIHGHKMYQKKKGIEYPKYAFCKSVQCPELIDGRCHQDADHCLFTAKQFYLWLQSAGFKIMRF